MNDKRKCPRINIWVPASLECYDDNGELFNRKLGVILDISLGGMLIETDDIIKANYVEVVFVNFKHKLMSIVASIVHSRKSKSGKQKQGFAFMEQKVKTSKLQLI